MASGTTFVFITANAKAVHCRSTPVVPWRAVPCRALDYGYELNTQPFLVCSNFQIRIFGLHDDTKHSLTQISGSFLCE